MTTSAHSHPGAGPGSIASPEMKALAQITGGIAPALGDLLTVIRGQAAILLDRAEPAAATQEPLKQIYAAAEKAVSLLRQLQIFSGQQTAHSELTELNALITESAGVLHRLLGERIAVEFRLAPDLPLVVADRAMLEQLLIILALNARDAMPAGGRLLVQTEAVNITDAARPDWPGGRTGKFIGLSVDDTGSGIAPEILPRIFEPFFTTKPAGRSLGLGLATAHGIVRQHGGWITVKHRIGGGMRFQVVLPIAPADTVAAAAPGADPGGHRGNETILLVEDEAGVREFVAFVLKDQGYRVLQATSGLDALEVWRWHGARVRLLLTDIVLEDNMTGLDLATKLRADHPGLPVICTTGYERAALQRFPGLEGGYHYLQKPCRPQALLAAVRAVLDEQLAEPLSAPPGHGPKIHP